MSMEVMTDIQDRVKHAAPGNLPWSARLFQSHSEGLSVVDGITQPPSHRQSFGVNVSVIFDTGAGYAATSDTSASGLAKAFEAAIFHAKRAEKNPLFDAGSLPQPRAAGRFEQKPEKSWAGTSLSDKIDMLQSISDDLKGGRKPDTRIVHRQAALHYTQNTRHFLSSSGADILQNSHRISPYLKVVAAQDGETQSRSLRELDRQGGLECLDHIGFKNRAMDLHMAALALLDAPNCPTDTRDLLLMPDQMALQIHESIGHPLELDRILGDERNYAGTSFVTPDMFGSFRYGSELLNITFDPDVAGEVGSYAYDDDGTKAQKTYLIKDGILHRPLGGGSSITRAHSAGFALEGVANARAVSWNRAPIDRMANLNLEPGHESLDDMISRTERGILMHTNKSWSIDDSRNKFQFGCEYGRLIENGELKGVVRNPNYRGISQDFWRSLHGVGSADTFHVHGVSNCGKGEPNQAIFVGHAAPPCLFRKISIFGGAT